MAKRITNGPSFYTCELHYCKQTGKTVRLSEPNINEGQGLPISMFSVNLCSQGGALIECRKCGQIIGVVK